MKNKAISRCQDEFSNLPLRHIYMMYDNEHIKPLKSEGFIGGICKKELVK